MYDNPNLMELFNEKNNLLASLPDSMDKNVAENNCGDAVLFLLQDGQIRWFGHGCFITTCAAELACEWYNTGQTEITIETLKEKVSGKLPPRRNQCLQVVVDAYEKFRLKDETR